MRSIGDLYTVPGVTQLGLNPNGERQEPTLALLLLHSGLQIRQLRELQSFEQNFKWRNKLYNLVAC